MPISSVNAAPLTITANDVNKTYGTTLTGGPGSTAFSTTGLQNSETIGSVSIGYGTGLAATDGVGTYTNCVTIANATGGTFSPNNYNITYVSGNIIVNAAPLTITANDVNKTYGTTLTSGPGSTAFTTTGLQNSETIGSVAIGYGTGLAATDGVGTYNKCVTIANATGGTFSPNNYNITYVSGNIIVNPAPLTITANDVNKTYGTTLTSGPGSTAFTTTGLQNSETIGSVAIGYGTGLAATDGVGTYFNCVTIANATGGTFSPNNYNITYVSGNIIVNA
ncbi:MBG domain-containing protein, partial [Mucilaginibacter sp.]